MICKKCGEHQGQAAPQCVEVSSSGVRFVEHVWQGGSGRSLTSGGSRGGSMRSLMENLPGRGRGRTQSASQRPTPRAPQHPTIPGGPDMSEFFKLSGISRPSQSPPQRHQPLREQQPPYAPPRAPAHARTRGYGPDFLREDMPAHPNPFMREDMPQAPVKVERTGPLTHAEILRECAPICRKMGPGHMGTDNPGRLVRGAPIVAKYQPS